MRLLVVFQARDSAADHPGYFAAFEQLLAEGRLTAFAHIPFVGVLERAGWAGLWAEIVERAREFKPDAVFFHFFHRPGEFDARPALENLRALPSRPVLFASLGDPFGRWTNRLPSCMRDVARAADVTFLTGMGHVAQVLRRDGARNLVLMPHGMCQERFSAVLATQASEPRFDVVFIGNRPRPRNPFSHYAATIRARVRFVAEFTRRFGSRFAVFGRGWEGEPSAQGPIPYLRQHDACRLGRVVVGGMPNGYHDFYLSDRPFIAMGSGVPFVDYKVAGVDRIFEDGRDWFLGDSIEAIAGACERLLALGDAERRALGAEARSRIFTGHTQYHRCAEMVAIVEGVLGARRAGKPAAAPELSFVTPGTPGVVAAWTG